MAYQWFNHVQAVSFTKSRPCHAMTWVIFVSCLVVARIVELPFETDSSMMKSKETADHRQGLEGLGVCKSSEGVGVGTNFARLDKDLHSLVQSKPPKVAGDKALSVLGGSARGKL